MARALGQLGDVIIRAVSIGCASLLTNKYLASFVVCTGASMEPTLQTGNVIITDKISPRLGNIDIGDIVIAKSPEDEDVCKRVTALPGELVVYKNQIYQIPSGHVWLLGDNKSDSNDSRFYGPVPINDISSRCWFRIWPDVNHSVLHQFQRTPKYSRVVNS